MTCIAVFNRLEKFCFVKIIPITFSRNVDWSKISPTIFGGIFESTLNPETRRKGGMHYTSPENIHKVIDPLFLDDLKAEFEAIRSIILALNAFEINSVLPGDFRSKDEIKSTIENSKSNHQ